MEHGAGRWPFRSRATVYENAFSATQARLRQRWRILVSLATWQLRLRGDVYAEAFAIAYTARQSGEVTVIAKIAGGRVPLRM